MMILCSLYVLQTRLWIVKSKTHSSNEFVANGRSSNYNLLIVLYFILVVSTAIQLIKPAQQGICR